MRPRLQYLRGGVGVMRADLHIHSTISDGSETIEEIAREAESRGLDAVAITDHDTLTHLAEISRLCENSRVKIIGGIEISAIDPKTGTKAHILGYRIKDPDVVTALTQPLLEARNENSERQAEILRRNGYDVDSKALHRADGKYLYKQHIMEYLVSTGQAKELSGEFYNSTFKNNGICAFDIDYIDAFTAVKTIKKAGGLAVLAHAGQQQNFYLIPELVKEGLDGLELNHPANGETDKVILRRYADAYGLFLTGGSDSHGSYEQPAVEVGDFISDESGALAICSE